MKKLPKLSKMIKVFYGSPLQERVFFTAMTERTLKSSISVGQMEQRTFLISSF